MKLFKNRTFLGATSIAMAIVICLVVAPAISASMNKDVQIVRVKQNVNIPENTEIKKEMIETVEVGSYNLPSNVFKNEKDVVGKYTTAALQPQDYILDTKTSDKNQAAYLSDLDGTKQALSISIKSFAAGLSGKLESGDVISLVVSSYGDTKKTFAPDELRYVKLLAATTEKGTDTDQKKQTENKDDSNDADNIPATLTLLVTPEQKTKLVDYETNGKLYTALVFRGAAQDAKKYLDIEDQYLTAHKDATGTVQGQSSASGTGGATFNGQ
jgi:pilus assembly protein CpaB